MAILLVAYGPSQFTVCTLYGHVVLYCVHTYYTAYILCLSPMHLLPVSSLPFDSQDKVCCYPCVN